MYLVDTGATHDGTPGVRAREIYEHTIRKLIESSTINTANLSVDVEEGVRVCLAAWDATIDATLMETSNTNLASVGQRVIRAAFTFSWSRGRLP